MGEGFEDTDGPIGPDALLPAQDRLWRHPAERGAEQAAANLAARRTHGRSWPAMMMSFVAGCCVVGIAWMLSNTDEPATIEEVLVNEIIPEEVAFEGTLSFDDWVNDVAELNRMSVVTLHLGGEANQEIAQAILLRDDGHLMTSAQAIAGAEDITAQFPGGSGPAELLASDAVSGVAVLKINSPGLLPPTFGNESEVLVQDRLVALAHSTNDAEPAPLGVELVGTNQVAMTTSGHLLSGAFRLDEDLDEEWSGSAILSEDGGIVAMAVSSRNGNTYAIPIAEARDAANQLISTGTVEHKSFLGVERSPLSDNLKESRGLLGGVLLTRVWGETPAARAGLVAGDIITRAGSVNVLDRTDLGEALALHEPGSIIEITVARATNRIDSAVTTEVAGTQSELITTTVILGARPS